MVQRWITYLDTFQIHWVHRKGIHHTNADSLSRSPPTRLCKYKDCPDCGVAREDCDCNCYRLSHNALLHTVFALGVSNNHAQSTNTNNNFDNWLGQWSNEQIREWQQGDTDISQFINLKKTYQDRPPFKDVCLLNKNVKIMWATWSDFHIRDNVLYREKHTSSHKQTTLQFMAPTTLQTLIMRQLHDTRIGGHLGIRKTHEKIKQRFFWVGCKQDVIRWCKYCTVCAQKSGTKTRAPMQHTPVGSPLEKVAMDIMGPFPISDSGNSYILVVSDYFTRWVEAYPIPDMTAQVVADKFVTEFITRYGIPEQIHTDQGSDFMSNLFKEMAKLLDIYQTRTTPYHLCLMD